MSTTPKLLQKVEALNDEGKYQEVIDLLPDALLEERQSAELYTERARAHDGLKNLDKQWEYCEKAIVLNAGYYKVYNSRGNYWNDKGEYDKAIADYDRAIELKADYASAFHNRGIVWHKKGDYAKAIMDYDQAIALKPDYALAYNNRGVIWKDKNEYDKAIADYNQAITLKPGDALVYHNRGIAWVSKGDYIKAVNDFKYSISLKKNYAKPYFGLAIVYTKREVFNLAEAYYRRAYFLHYDAKEFIKLFFREFINPFLLLEVLQKVVNLRTFIQYQTEITICEKDCEKWVLLLNYFEYSKIEELLPAALLRIQALVNYYMGHAAKTYSIIDENLENHGLNLRDQYYFIVSANGFLEPVEWVIFHAKKQIVEEDMKTSADWYYAGQIYIQLQEYENAECAFLQAGNSLPACYALFGLYNQQKRFEDELAMVDRIKELETQEDSLHFLNGIEPMLIGKDTIGDSFEAAFYERLYYYELLEEINGVRVILGPATIFKHLEFWDLPEFDEELTQQIEEENTKRDNQAFFKELVESYKKLHNEKVLEAVNKQCSVNPNIQDINDAVSDAVTKYSSNFEQQIAIRIEAMKQDAIVYLVVIKHFYFQQQITAEEAVTLHFFVLKKTMESNDSALVTGLDEELKTWLPLLSEALQSPAIVKIFMKAWSRIQNGKEEYKMDHFKDYQAFKARFITHYLPWWRDTICRKELEKHQFGRKTDMTDN